ncbi:hypothetical protein [Parasutterella excrementihominis]
MAMTREEKNAYERERYRKAHPQRKRKIRVMGRPKLHEGEKPILPQKPFSALFTPFFINRNPKK